MPLVNRILIKILFSLFSLVALGQTNNIAIGQWRAHLPFANAKLVADAGEKIYCAGVSGMFSFTKADNSIEILSKVQGLSDVTITALAFSKENNVLFIGYENGNIDLLSGSDIFNIPDIKRKQINARKTINNVFFYGSKAYLACGFGIVEVDLAKKEIKDSYLIGPGGGYLDIYDVTADGTSFFAGTESGIYKALMSEENLSDFQVWVKQTNISNSTVNNGPFNAVHFFNGHVYANYSRFFQNGQSARDTVFRWNGTSWKRTRYSENYALKTIRSNSRNLVFNCDSVMFVVRADSTKDLAYQYLDNFGLINDGIADEQDILWIGDQRLGLVKRDLSNTFVSLSPSGPSSVNVFDMTFRDGELWIAPGGKDFKWTQQNNNEGLSVLRNNTWVKLGDPIIWSHPDILSIDVNPLDHNQLFGGTWGSGIVEFNPDGAVNSYFTNGTRLQIQQQVSNYPVVRVGDTKFDQEGNLWMSNWYVSEPLVVLTADKTWEAFDFTSINVDKPEVARLLTTRDNQVWMQARTTGVGGILVYDHKGTVTDKSDDESRHLNTSVGQGALPSNEIMSFAQDKDGAVWVGTDKGVAVFYSPSAIFSSESFDAQSVLINQDGHTQKLLETETVTSIVIDGANRKWFGTQSSGIYLMSADGTKQLEHFTSEDSPLLSNTVIDMELDPVSGEIYVATEKGLISYKGTSTEGETKCEDTYAYPNPVRPGYSGLIAIKGLVTNAHVRIVDISGNLVYETRAFGGQAIWEGKNHNGNRVQSGVYIVFASNEDGSQTCVTKILFIN